MGLINTTERATREIQAQTQVLTRRQQQIQEEKDYKKAIKKYTLAALEKNINNYYNLDQLYYNRYNYIDEIVKDVEKSGIISDGINYINRYKKRDIYQDVNDSFYTNFNTFKRSYKIDKKASAEISPEEDPPGIEKNNILKDILIIIISITIIILVINYFIFLLGAFIFIVIIYSFIDSIIRKVKKHKRW